MSCSAAGIGLVTIKNRFLPKSAAGVANSLEDIRRIFRGCAIFDRDRVDEVFVLVDQRRPRPFVPAKTSPHEELITPGRGGSFPFPIRQQQLASRFYDTVTCWSRRAPR